MESPSRNESELLASASRGDLAAVEELLVRYLGDLEGFVRRRTHLPSEKESASDLVQSICLTVLARLAALQHPALERSREGHAPASPGSITPAWPFTRKPIRPTSSTATVWR